MSQKTGFHPLSRKHILGRTKVESNWPRPHFIPTRTHKQDSYLYEKRNLWGLINLLLIKGKILIENNLVIQMSSLITRMMLLAFAWNTN